MAVVSTVVDKVRNMAVVAVVGNCRMVEELVVEVAD